MKASIASKLPSTPPSIFAEMNSLAREYNAINLAQGFPDFEADPYLIELVTNAMNSGYNQYAPMAGIYSLREAISGKIARLHNNTYDPDTSITLTVGATQAIYDSITAFVHPGNEVIIFQPAYDCYEPAIRINGGVPVFVPLQGPEHRIDWSLFKAAMSSKTRMVVVNTPHNPSGTIFSEDDMLQLEKLLRDTDILVLCDEAYEHLVFDGFEHQSVARFPGLASRSLICASFGKTFHTTGWKMGYCAAPPALMEEFRKIHEFNVYCINHPVQRALAVYLQDENTYLGLAAFFQEKRDYFLSAVSGSRFTAIPSQGTYFQLLDYSAISEEGDVAFASRMAKEFGLAGIPVSVFRADRQDHLQLRFCFAKKKETLERAGDILIGI